GKGPILINFWATWCKPCIEELHQFQKIFDDYKAKGFNLITVSTDNEKTVGKVKPFIKTKNFTFTVLLDKNSDIAKKYYAHQLPFNVLIDKEGNILYTNMGYIKGNEIKIKQLLDEIFGL
ncbi:MAG: TlpA family protein disulfide reductase, partial [Ignavibacteria bacterium]|nr:TlpA family protein disulfide reductase [Ignavibacteria bacterium]